jgi:predicted ATPase with chaperone activity
MFDVQAPPIPRTIEETGLDEGFLRDLVLKHVYFGGSLQTIELAHRAALDFAVVSILLEELKRQLMVTASGGSGAFGGMWFHWAVTRQGREKVEEIMGRDGYRGPAPVPFAQYSAQLAHQRIDQHDLTPAKVEYAFSRLVLDPQVVRSIGPAIKSGRPVFLYGPSGNGKTSMADCITEAMRGGVFVPRALIAEGEIMVVFDEVHHERIGTGSGGGGAEGEHDARWAYCKRPTVVVGGEATLEMLDLQVITHATFYKAPLQVKSNSGVLFIDDFGRQRCDPRELLNRWIVPLESRFDYLTFASGQKVRVPFDSLVVFSTNLDPRQLVDDAFLRRIRYKILIDRPTPAQYREIFKRQCQEHDIAFNAGAVDYLLQRHYFTRGRELRACEPRDLVEQLLDLHRFDGTPTELTPPLIDRLADLYFVEIAKPAVAPVKK